MKPIRVVVRMLSSFFWIGYFPVAPGTAGSFAGMVLWYALPFRTLKVRLFMILLLFVVGVIVATVEEKALDKKDPGNVVIDEVVGIWLLFALIGCLNLRENIVRAVFAFILFRLFDIIKVPPMRGVEKLRGGVGIMLDDVIAAVYSAIVINLGIIILQ